MMTEMPESSQTPEMMDQEPQDEAPSPAFEPFLPSVEPPKRSRVPIVFAVLGVLVLVGGLVFHGRGADKAEAKNVAVDYTQMTAEKLGEDSSPGAARELVRRFFSGEPAERAGAASVMHSPHSPRLTRNLAMAMALEQQKRAQAMRVNVERNMRMAEQGY